MEIKRPIPLDHFKKTYTQKNLTQKLITYNTGIKLNRLSTIRNGWDTPTSYEIKVLSDFFEMEPEILFPELY